MLKFSLLGSDTMIFLVVFASSFGSRVQTVWNFSNYFNVIESIIYLASVKVVLLIQLLFEE